MGSQTQQQYVLWTSDTLNHRGEVGLTEDNESERENMKGQGLYDSVGLFLECCQRVIRAWSHAIGPQ